MQLDPGWMFDCTTCHVVLHTCSSITYFHYQLYSRSRNSRRLSCLHFSGRFFNSYPCSKFKHMWSFFIKHLKCYKVYMLLCWRTRLVYFIWKNYQMLASHIIWKSVGKKNSSFPSFLLFRFYSVWFYDLDCNEKD